MLRMTITMANSYVSLGINGVESFFKQFSPSTNEETAELDAVQTIDDAFLEKARAMETHLFGFTQEYKAKMLEVFEKHKGKKCYISNDWFVSDKNPKAQATMRFVTALDEGKTFEQATEDFRAQLN